jgi:glycosyltransferase involved in cell wall biosynthesis
MRIAQVVTQMEAAGAQKVAYLLHQAFLNLGHDSELWFLYTKRPSYAGVPGVKSLLPRRATPLHYPSILKRLWTELHRYRPDALITHTHYANVMGQSAAKLAGVPTRIAVHHNPLPTYPRQALLADLILRHLRVYSGVVAVSDVVADSVRALAFACGAQAVHRIYNGLPPIDSKPPSHLPEVRRKWNIPEGRPVLLNVGRLSWQKNHSTLFRVIHELPNLLLIVAGDGELAADLRSQVSGLSIGKQVLFTGEITEPEVRSLMKCADVFVFPSLWEAMPMALVEAMSSGMAIVASDIPAHREVLGSAGLLVPPTNTSAVANAIQRLLSDPLLTEKLRAQAMDRAKCFSLEAMVEGYERLICHLAVRTQACLA